MGSDKYTLTELVDVETLTKIQRSFAEITGMKIHVVENIDDGKEYEFKEPIMLNGEILGYLRSKGIPDKAESTAAILKNEASILSSVADNNYKLKLLNEEFEKSATLKSDFLANMSHEIRTPMNAVIGMAEMALREELPVVAREYIRQIKSSGKSLLTIINDILDFSKIESGKLDIIYSEYDVMSMINDVSNVILARIGKKDVELIVDVDPNFPKTLMGDDVRIKQIIINLANNAVKFTNHGQVILHLDYFRKNDYEMEMSGYIEDTGIGIKEENLDGIFESFQQVNSKRNRNIEGTGLGLAITKNLLEMMYGKILVESEYGVGSKFAFTLPQRIVSTKPSVVVPDAQNIKVAGLIDNVYERAHLESEIIRLGAVYFELVGEDGSAGTMEGIIESIKGKEIDFVFVENQLFDEKIKAFADENPDVTVAVIADYSDVIEFEEENIVVVRKPIYAANLGAVLRHESVYSFIREDEDYDVDFIAPDAKILLVDDNTINLTVAQGLLEPLQMQIDTASSGMEAIEKISHNSYDMIFMDHMMPEMDGVEAMKIIRETYPEYYGVPIIALTANAVEETRTMFIAEGMNDFVAKPIEMKLIAATIKRWLPEDKKKPIVSRKKAGKSDEAIIGQNLKIGDLDTAYARKMLSTEELFWKVLKDYYQAIDKKAELIRKYYSDQDWQHYTIEVHALKSASKQIGALKLSDVAAELEKAGNALDIDYIKDKTESMLEKYTEYKNVLSPYFENNSLREEQDGAVRHELPKEVEAVYVEALTMAVSDLDFDTIEATISELEKYDLLGESKEYYKALTDAFDNVDFEECAKILGQWSLEK